MANPFRRFIKKLTPTEILDGTVNTTKLVFESAAALKPEKGKPQVEELTSLVNHADFLLDMLNSPLGEVVEKGGIPFVSIAARLLKLYLDKSKVPPTFEDCIDLAAQAAYLESFQFFLKADQSLLKRVNDTSGSDVISQKLRILADIEVNREMAERVMTQFPTSNLIQSFGEVLQARLVEAGLSKKEAQRLTERVAWHAPRYLNEIWAKSEEAVKHLGQTTLPEWQTEKARYQSLEDYLREVIQPGPEESVFGEPSLTFRHIYVPLEIKHMDERGKYAKFEEDKPIIAGIEEWVEEHLLDSTKKEVLFVQGEAGRGKSVFCRMFADWVRASLYPAYIPILIRLREIRHLAQNFSDTLKNILETQQFVVADNSWLTRKDTRFLFLLDGFDELLLEGRGDSGGLKEFLQQVEQFQLSSHHRFVITGRPLALQGMERLISQAKQLQRVELQPMRDPLKQKWFIQWTDQFGWKEARAFQQFLAICPQDVGDVLAREPLLLYLLGRMHREGRLKAAMFEGTEEIQAKVVIYDEVVRWVIEEQRKNENLRLVGLKSEDLRDVLTEVAVCVMQSGNEVAKVSFLEARLAKDSNNPMYALLREAHQDLHISEKKLLNNVVTTFYIKPAAGDREGSVEFVHKSFGEFLFAERLAYALEDWSKKGKDRRSKWSVSDEVMHREIYDLLGYGGLSKEVVDYVMAIILKPTQTTSRRLENTQWCQLFERLQDFYLRWWEGEFIDAVQNKEVNLPRGKMLSLREQIPDREEPLGLRQVDVHTGLNALILLFEIHRYGQSQDALEQTLEFHPCGQREKANFEVSRLNRIIGYSECVEAGAFNRFIGRFLSYADLSEADLNGADLSHVNLSEADLSHVNLNGADLSGADLSGADLRDAELSHANLSKANLSRADFDFSGLRRADLSEADLNGADFGHTDLNGADLNGANLRGANLRDADLGHTDLGHTDLSGADFSGANLRGAEVHLEQLDQSTLCETALPDGTVSNRDCK
jgi:uncharacterized protein YjbI with pentapeptide repeats